MLQGELLPQRRQNSLNSMKQNCCSEAARRMLKTLKRKMDWIKNWSGICRNSLKINFISIYLAPKSNSASSFAMSIKTAKNFQSMNTSLRRSLWSIQEYQMLVVMKKTARRWIHFWPNWKQKIKLPNLYPMKKARRSLYLLMLRLGLQSMKERRKFRKRKS